MCLSTLSTEIIIFGFFGVCPATYDTMLLWMQRSVLSASSILYHPKVAVCLCGILEGNIIARAWSPCSLGWCLAPLLFTKKISENAFGHWPNVVRYVQRLLYPSPPVSLSVFGLCRSPQPHPCRRLQPGPLPAHAPHHVPGLHRALRPPVPHHPVCEPPGLAVAALRGPVAQPVARRPLGVQ